MKIQHSPVDEKYSATLIDEFSSNEVAEGYKSNFSIDISRFINSKLLKKYRCDVTGLEFYRGIIAGDGKFYSELMKFDWYYDPWKWEHETVKKMLNPNENLLEIGSGSGGFLNGIREYGNNGKGIEINSEAVKIANANGLDVTHDDLKLFALKHENTFDWCVSFQVLEHIEDVAGFISNSVKLLKPGGKMVISVPNNDSFIGRIYNLMNLPPHHINRWTKESLNNIAPIFGLEFERFEFEPLQEYHYNWYVNSILENKKPTFTEKLPVLKGLMYRKTKKTIEQWVKQEAKNIIGHSILAVYTKKIK